MRWRKGWGRAARPARAPTARALTPTTLSTSLQAKRRRQFECSQDKAKRKVKEVRMRRRPCPVFLAGLIWNLFGEG